MEQKSQPLSLKNLEYIALEGGGGKGAVYKGAIEALEELLYQEFFDGKLNYRGKNKDEVEVDSKNKPSIFNYTNSSDEGDLKIKGIAGASTGSINAFALSVGLSSDKIDEILGKFDFEAFLKQIDTGKYKMIGKGDSKKNPCTIEVGEDNFKKLGDGGSRKIYKFQPSKIFTVIGDPLKNFLRHTIIAVSIKSILSGILESLNQFSKIFYSTGRFKDREDIDKIKPLFTWLFKLRDRKQELLSLAAIDKVIFALIFKVFFKNKAKNLVSMDSIANLLWDRGLFSGFIVREFLLNCMLSGIKKKDSYCQTGFIEFFIKNGISKERFDSIDIDFDRKIDNIRKCDIPQDKLQKIYSISFHEFYEVTNVNLVIGATNTTTSQPMFFSHHWTPDFPVLEAVGMSMNIPPALKAIYNEADVIYQEKYPESVLKDIEKSIDLNKYYKVANKVMTYVKIAFDLRFSLNGNLGFSSFLPFLRELIFVTDCDGKVEDYPNRKLPLNAIPIGIDKPTHEELVFCYNSVFKGLYIDSGVTNNIPYNAFRIWDNNEMNKTLALKLDNFFPEKYLDDLISALDKDSKNPMLKSPKAIDEIEAGIQDEYELISPYLKGKINSVLKQINKNYYEDLNKKSYKQIKKALNEIRDERNKNFTPWNKQVNAIGGLLNALQYGFDQGQIRQLSDNNNIIPLYCYGIGTYDFNLKDLKPLAVFANTQSKKDVIDYFEVDKPKIQSK